MPNASYSTFNIPAGVDVLQNVGYNPTAVIVSNYSPYYIYFPDGLNFCPPWTSGAIIPLSHATQARAVWNVTPFGAQTIVPTPAGVQFTAALQFTNDQLGVASGTLITNPFAPDSLPTYTMASQNCAVGTVATTSFQLMAGGLYVRIRYVDFMQTTATAINGPVTIGMYRLTTAGTGGTVRTGSVHDPSDPAARARGMDNPAVEGAKTVFSPMFSRWFTATPNTFEPEYRYDFIASTGKAFVIPPGLGIAFVPIVTTVGVGGANFNIQFTEGPI